MQRKKRNILIIVLLQRGPRVNDLYLTETSLLLTREKCLFFREKRKSVQKQNILCPGWKLVLFVWYFHFIMDTLNTFT